MQDFSLLIKNKKAIDLLQNWIERNPEEAKYLPWYQFETQQNLADVAYKFQNTDALRLLAKYGIYPENKLQLSINQIIPFSQIRKGKAKKPKFVPSCILIGDVGCGKTSTFNNLCGTNRLVQEGGKSTTRTLACVKVMYGNGDFQVIDTPGMNSTQQTYKHGYLLYSGLTAKRHTAIIIVLHFKKRTPEMIQDYHRITFPFQRYDGNFIIMISHFDQSKDRRKRKEQITKAFRDEQHIDADIIFFSNDEAQNCDLYKLHLSNRIYHCMCKLSPIDITLSKEDFFSCYKLYHPDGHLSKLYQQFIHQAKRIEKDYHMMTKIALTDEDPQSIFNFLLSYFKKEIDGFYLDNLLVTEGLIQRFQKKAIQTGINDLEEYTIKIELVKQGIKIKENFKRQIQGFINQKLIMSSGIKQLVRRCPHCSLIWIKSSGCNGSTRCGNRPNGKQKLYKFGFDPYSANQQAIKNNQSYLWGYQMFFDEFSGSRKYRKMNKIQSATSNNYKSQVKQKPLGCGKQFTWSDAPMVEQSILLSLFQTDSIQLIKAMIVSDEKTDKVMEIERKFGQKVRQYQKTISTRFQTS